MSDDEDIIVNEDLTTTVMLRKPIMHNDREIKSVTFPADATVAHLEAADKGKGDIEKAVRLMAELVGISYHAVRKMNASDFNRAAAVLNNLMGKDQEIGGTL